MEARLIAPHPSDPAPSPAPLQSVGRLVAGLFFAAAGVLLTADNLDLLDAGRFLRYWPGLLILLGILKLVDGRSSKIVGGMLIVAGSWMLALVLNVVDFTIFDLWPLILIGVGVTFLMRAVGVNPWSRFPRIGSAGNLALFTNQKITDTSPDFHGANLVAVMGGYHLDLTGADITSGPAVIDVFTFWGGIEIIVPDDWQITSEVTPVMAGFEARSGANATSAKRLEIRGAAIMAGVEVRNASGRKS